MSRYFSELIVLNDIVPNVGIKYHAYRQKELLADTRAVYITWHSWRYCRPSDWVISNIWYS